jgi:type III secretion system YscQ/HrcQ family protein
MLPLQAAAPWTVTTLPSQAAAPRTQPWTATMLPSQAAAAVHWCNKLYASPPWRADGGEWRWQASPQREARSIVMLNAGDDDLRLAFHDDVVGSGEAALDNWADYDEPARGVMWTLAHERVLDLLARFFVRDWIVRSVALPPFAPEPRDRDDRCAGFVCRAGTMQLSGTASMSAALARSALERKATADRAVVDAASSVWAQGRVRMTCVIDRVSAFRADLAALRIGALVLLDNPTLATEPTHVRLVLGQRELLCELRGSRLLVLHVNLAGGTMTIEPIQSAALHDEPTDASAPDTDPSTRLADHTPVTLSFEAGSVSLPLAQLAGVREGYTFFLPQGLDAATIRVLANGVPVGSGQLVRIDDVVGVQLTQLDPQQ